MPATPFLGQVMLTPYNFAPFGWAMCNGQLLAISQNTALFALLGTSYGGNGQFSFGLPDLRGRIPVSFGQGPGLLPYNLGDKAGVETVTLAPGQMPAHTHTPQASALVGNSPSPIGTTWARSTGGDAIYGPPGSAPFPAAAIGSVGGQPHENRMPSLTFNYCIALQGIFPARS
jgi:microcystin-dependent protein